MKKIILTLLMGSIMLAGIAQNTRPKAPDNAVLVINYAGSSLTKNVPLSRINSYEFIKNKLWGELGLDSVSSIEQTGIDFEKDLVQYAVMEDSSNSFVTILPLKNETAFLNLVQKEKELLTENSGAYKTATLASNKYLGWTPKMAVFVYTSHKAPNYDYRMESESEAVDSVVTETTIELEAMADSVVAALDSAAAAVDEEAAMEEESPDTIPPSIEEITAPHETETDTWYNLRQQYIAEKQKLIADSLIQLVFSETQRSSIEDKPIYLKTIDPAAPVSIWFNYDNLMSGLWSVVPRNVFGVSGRYGMAGNLPSQKITSGVNFYFDKDKIRLEQKIFSGDAATSKLLRDIFDNKQQSSLCNYIAADNIGFVSGSFNTEAVGKYYYKTLREYLSGNSFFGRYSELTDIYIDLLEIMIDEKAIADLMPGNFVMALHKLNTKTVSYTTYEYDEDFKSKEIKKTKQELSPDFTIAFETRRSDFLTKLADLPTKYAEKEKFKYSFKNGYYELQLDPEKEAIDHLYFVLVDDKVVMTTSMDMVQLTLKKTRQKLPKDIRQFISKNNYAISVNTDKLLSQISPELSTNTSKKIRAYLQENMGNFKFESRIKDGMINSSGTMDIKGKHANGLEFLFNIVDDINRILEEDKIDKTANKL